MTSSDPTSSSTQPQSSESDAGVAQKAQEARQRLQKGYHDIEQTYGDTRARLDDFNEQATRFIRENPGLCIVGAVAAGYLIGRLASRRWLV